MIKMAHIRKSTTLTDVQDLPVCLRQKIDRVFQTFLVDILSRSFPADLLHQPAEMARRTGRQLTHSFIAFLKIFDLGHI